MEEQIERVAKDLVNSKCAIALTGAGISTESGIPDFRGPSEIWTKDPDAILNLLRSAKANMPPKYRGPGPQLQNSGHTQLASFAR